MKLTQMVGNDIYASSEPKMQLVQKLGEIEHKEPQLLAKICDEYCMFPQVLGSQEAVDEKCESCPMKELMEIIE